MHSLRTLKNVFDAISAKLFAMLKIALPLKFIAEGKNT